MYVPPQSTDLKGLWGHVRTESAEPTVTSHEALWIVVPGQRGSSRSAQPCGDGTSRSACWHQSKRQIFSGIYFNFSTIQLFAKNVKTTLSFIMEKIALHSKQMRNRSILTYDLRLLDPSVYNPSRFLKLSLLQRQNYILALERLSQE